MVSLASTYRDLGRFEEALILQVQVLESFKKILGEEHPDTLNSMTMSLPFRQPLWQRITRKGWHYRSTAPVAIIIA
jgi:hypothetical protein